MRRSLPQRFRRHSNKEQSQVTDKKTAVKSGMGRDVFMLVLGAMVTLLSTGITTYFAERKADRKETLSKKLELNRDLSKEIGVRFYLTYDILTRRISLDSSISNDSNTINRQVSELQESRKAWNQNIHSYKALVSYYYGRQTLDNFVDSIYIPFIELGNYALARKTYNDKAWIADQSARLNENIQAFADEIYKLALE